MDLTEKLNGIRAIVFDVGETLVSEARSWSELANEAGISEFTFFSVFGSLIERRVDHRTIWDELRVRPPAGKTAVTPADLYADAAACIEAVKTSGRIVGIAGNQPIGIERQLRAIGLSPHFLASSATWRVSKPEPDFFDRIVDAADVEAGQILYVGDRIDNDIVPAKQAGMMTAFVQRGPWAVIQRKWSEARAADIWLESLEALTEGLCGTDSQNSITKQ
ncbi:HAD family hydrolase [Brevibacterium sp. JSBI002]|uniref:HAD family hydrolase n=1 Tax=Brevibacterium sp. JSBI002 TaxID=2886045 RepID=UPI0022320715|nr:HAD family hydrolase [Brevibacterium sp. JSBI002]UZD62938.1 HAD family hydrolase [Brevibacterium sp. JSBI002]